MTVKIIMPQGGQDITEGFVVRWFKKEGEPVRRGELLCEVETEKAVFEVESPSDGVLLKIVAQAGTKVPIFAVIGVVGVADEAVDLDQLLSEPAAPAEKPLDVPVPPSRMKAAMDEAAGRFKVTGRARKLAIERGVDLHEVSGSGPQGRITEKDVLIHVEKPKLQVSALRGQMSPLTRMRQAIARRMLISKQSIPHFYVTTSADVTAALELRSRLSRETGEDVSITAFLLKASAAALKEFPAVNCQLQEEQIIRLEDVNIGVAVDIENGLMVPVLAKADQRSLSDISRWLRTAKAAARQGRLPGLETASFTVTNLGMTGIETFSAIINPPEAGILAVGAVQKRPIVQNDTALCIRDMVTMTLSVDHRLVDGALAARFISRIQCHLENPASLTN
jgi:pyruvate dehydrogenase E2 component (dihydrolipoamide acetyltransferase)